MIELRNITKSYQVDHQVTTVLNDINLNIKEGELVGIIGASGSGKSTLMHIIGLLDTPSSGKVILNNQEVSKLSDDKISHLRNQFVGFVFQQFNLINKLTVAENILLPTLYTKTKLSYNPQDKAQELMTRFGIDHRQDFHPNNISGGEQQRVAMARSLIMNPKIVLADEPTGNLDSKNGEQIMQLLEKLNKDLKVTIVVVTHEQVVAKKTRRKIFLKDGEIVKKLT